MCNLFQYYCYVIVIVCHGIFFHCIVSTYLNVLANQYIISAFVLFNFHCSIHAYAIIVDDAIVVDVTV